VGCAAGGDVGVGGAGNQKADEMAAHQTAAARRVLITADRAIEFRNVQR